MRNLVSLVGLNRWRNVTIQWDLIEPARNTPSKGLGWDLYILLAKSKTSENFDVEYFLVPVNYKEL